MSGLAYTVSHTATQYTDASTIIFQLTTSASVPITITRVEVQTSFTTSSQDIVRLQWGYWGTGASTGGSTPTPSPLTKRNSVSAATGVRIASLASNGTTFTPVKEWQWNMALPFDHVMGLSSLQIDVPVSTVWALITADGPGTPYVSGAVDWIEH